MYVSECMRTTITTVPPDMLASTAYQLMTARRGSSIRHLPVVTAEGRLVGLVTDRDMRRVSASDAPQMALYELPALLAKLQVQDVMTAPVITVQGTTLLRDAGQLLLQKHIGCLPVVRDDNILEGLLTVTDFLRTYVAQYDAGRKL
ncbi:MAG: CBS domain-containing protein [Candidatus Tectimicrobiota bacterium]